MKAILSSILIAISISIINAQPDTSSRSISIQMEIIGIEEVSGKLGIQLYDKEQNLVSRKWVPVTATEMTADFTGIQPGTYAIQFYHDANDDGEMNFHWYGAPKEGYGNSNDVKGFFGPPEFSEQLVDFSNSADITMKLIK
ncbi:MAG: DUF2141 domain-containing protein [Flavobacteriales bacterium]|nr:DUF2141 domain-containing protein [Flavobacteriales bacterium]